MLSLSNSVTPAIPAIRISPAPAHDTVTHCTGVKSLHAKAVVADEVVVPVTARALSLTSSTDPLVEGPSEVVNVYVSVFGTGAGSPRIDLTSYLMPMTYVPGVGMV